MLFFSSNSEITCVSRNILYFSRCIQFPVQLPALIGLNSQSFEILIKHRFVISVHRPAMSKRTGLRPQAIYSGSRLIEGDILS